MYVSFGGRRTRCRPLMITFTAILNRAIELCLKKYIMNVENIIEYKRNEEYNTLC